MPTPADPHKHNGPTRPFAARFLTRAALLTVLASLPISAKAAPALLSEPQTELSETLTAATIPETTALIAYSSTWWLRFKAFFYVIYHILGGVGGDELTPPELASRANALFQSRGWPTDLSLTDTTNAITAVNGVLGLLQTPPDDLDPATAGMWSGWTQDMRRGLPDVIPGRP